MAKTDEFFSESREQSVVKATIVEKYFDRWARIIGATQAKEPNRPGNDRLGYVDLFAGPGRYESGQISTPLRILEKAVAEPSLAARLVTIFNDRDEANVQALKKEIAAIPGIEKLKHPPVFWNEELGEDGEAIIKSFQAIKNRMPVLAFIDPWGYKGLTLQLVNTFLRDWGCDCIFFFNYARINAGLNNPVVARHMAALFGYQKSEELGAALATMTPSQREATIVNALAETLQKMAPDKRYVLPFCFKSEEGTRTKHHLVLASKNFKGYDVMKDIMHKASTSHDQGVASFTFSPADSRKQPMLFDLSTPLDDLEGNLVAKFAGKTLTMWKIYETHSYGRHYIAKHYKHALGKLLQAGRITTDRVPRKGSFADHIVVTFPKR